MHGHRRLVSVRRNGGHSHVPNQAVVSARETRFCPFDPTFMSRNGRQAPFITSGFRIDTQKVASLSNESSNDPAEPITPLDTDEITIDHLWKQVRSMGKPSGSRRLPDAEDVEAQVVGKEAAAEMEEQRMTRPLSRRRSL